MGLGLGVGLGDGLPLLIRIRRMCRNIDTFDHAAVDLPNESTMRKSTFLYRLHST